MAASNVSIPSSCLSGSPPFPLPQIVDPSTGLVTCMTGFYCGNLVPGNASTYPVACQPTLDCATQRFFGNVCPQIQSIFEPQLCLAGYYCPNATQQLECPSGYFCPGGVATPIKCPGAAICPAGSKTPRDLGPLVALILVYIAVAVIRALYLRVWRLRGHVPGEVQLGRSQAFSATSAQTAGSVDASRAMDTKPLAEHFRTVSGPDSMSINIAFNQLRVTLPPLPGQRQGKVLLEGVSGELRPGTVTAIMGPSGAGKTVLLTTLLQRIDPSWNVEGAVRINGGKIQLPELRSFIGFVPQDDVLHTELTVEANLYYASELRLPTDWPAERRQAMREVVLEALGLTAHRTTVIGSETERGISGGQRKRVSIGVELASAPLLLFLDEPTSGLDSTTSLELVHMLKTIAVAANITVAMVVHQPRVEIWNALDDLLILGVGGRTIYRGPQKVAEEYFTNAGVAFHPTHNPADDIMDYVAEHSATLVARWSAHDELHEPVTPLVVADFGSAVFNGAGPIKQFGLFFLRSLEKQLSFILSLVIEALVIGLCGLVLGNSMQNFIFTATYKAPYDRISPSVYTLLLPQLHMYQLMSLGLAASVAGVTVFSLERQQYFREVPTGMYRASYFGGSVAAALFRVCISSLTYGAIFTALAALVVPFGYLFFAAMLSYWCNYAVGACIAVVATPASAPLIAGTTSIVFAVFNGFINFPVVMKHFSFGFYASQILQEQHAQSTFAWAQDPMATSSTGFESGLTAESFGILVVMAFGIHIIAYILMIATHRDKQR